MSFLLEPWHILLAALCGTVNERQQQVIEFQNAQIDALLKKPGKICTESWSFCGEGARSPWIDTNFTVSGRYLWPTLGRNRERFLFLKPDCQRALRPVQFFDPTPTDVARAGIVKSFSRKAA